MMPHKPVPDTYVSRELFPAVTRKQEAIILHHDPGIPADYSKNVAAGGFKGEEGL